MGGASGEPHREGARAFPGDLGRARERGLEHEDLAMRARHLEQQGREAPVPSSSSGVSRSVTRGGSPAGPGPRAPRSRGRCPPSCRRPPARAPGRPRRERESPRAFPRARPCRGGRGGADRPRPRRPWRIRRRRAAGTAASRRGRGRRASARRCRGPGRSRRTRRPRGSRAPPGPRGRPGAVRARSGSRRLRRAGAPPTRSGSPGRRRRRRSRGPGEVGTATVPSAATSTGGTMTSRSKYRRLAEMSPGRVKPGRLARATLCARPMPDSSIPPHHRGTPRSTQRSWMRSASL